LSNSTSQKAPQGRPSGSPPFVARPYVFVSGKGGVGKSLVAASLAAQAVALIEPLRDSVSTVRALSMHRNELFDGANYDLTLIVDFEDEAGLEFYAKHPEHQPALQFMPTIAAARVAVDFTV